MNFDPDQIDAFARYLAASGAEIRELTNPWELIRYKLPECGMLVVYQNAKGKITVPPVTMEHYALFRQNKPLVKHGRKGADFKAFIVPKLLERDGDTCVLCGYFLNGDITLEHFLNVSDGGTNRIANLGLAHERCNRLLGDLSIMEKIRLRDIIRERMKDVAPWDDVPDVAELLAPDAGRAGEAVL